jgi:hypothetical protein
MRQAVINFHLSEAQADFVESEFIQDEYLPSPQSSFMSNVPSPSTSAPVSRQANSTSRGPTDPPAQEELMDVWCLPSKPAAKIHTRRNMTPEEKKAYKAKRLAGACADCKRRRRKCDHDSSSSSPNQASSKKVKARKRTIQSPINNSCAAPSVTLANAPVAAAQENSTFTQDSFFSFDTGFDNSMDIAGFEISVGMGFDDNAGADLGFDLGTDFALFPDLASSTDLQSPEIDAASWLAGSPVSLDVNKQHAATTQDFNNWPLASYATAGVPLTPQSISPQSLLMTPMSRTQSGSSLSSTGFNMFASLDVERQAVLSQDFNNQPVLSRDAISSICISALSSRQSSTGVAQLNPQSVPMPLTSPLSPTSRIQSGGSLSSAPSSSSQHWPAASRVAPDSSMSHGITDHAFPGSTTNLERSDQHIASTTSLGNGLISLPSAQSGSWVAEHSPLSSLNSRGREEQARLRSSQQGATLPPDRSRTSLASGLEASVIEIQSQSCEQLKQQQPEQQSIVDTDTLRRRSTRTTSRTASRAFSSRNAQSIRSSDLIGQTGHLETPDRRSDLSKLCRLKHSSAFADDVCGALQSSAGLRLSSPSSSRIPLGGGSKSFVDNATNTFQWVILLLFAAMHLFGFSLQMSSGHGNPAASNSSPTLVIEDDDDTFTSTGKNNRTAYRKQPRTSTRRPSPLQIFSGFVQQSICRLGSKMEKVSSASGRLY